MKLLEVLFGIDRESLKAVSAAGMVFLVVYPLSEEAKICGQDCGN